jgi:hypothetical protein
VKPFKVLKNGVQTSEHKYYGQAESEAKATGAEEVYYRNVRGMGTTVWARTWAREERPVDAEGYL